MIKNHGSKGIFFVITGIIVALSCLSCSDADKSTTKAPVQRGILKDYAITERFQTTTQIDFASKESRPFLLKGWAATERSHTWARGLESSILFYWAPETLKDKLKMTITCTPFVFPNSPEQSVNIYVNGTDVTTLTLRQGLRKYKVSIPITALKRENVLTFTYAYAAKPVDHIPGATDNRDLAVMFTKVVFHAEPSLWVEGGRLYQKEGSALNYYIKTPEVEAVSVDFRNEPEGALTGVLTIELANGSLTSHSFEKPGSYTIELKNHVETVARVTFSARAKVGRAGDERSPYVVWSKIELVRRVWNKPEGNGRMKHGVQADPNLDKYDVVYIVLDAFTARHSTAYGYHRRTTPTMERIAATGIIMDRMFSTAPYTLASTASLFTSTYPITHGVITEKNRLSKNMSTLAGELSKGGVATFCVSANPFVSQDWGLTNGFETVYYKKDLDADHLVQNILPEIYEPRVPDKRRKFLYIHLMPPHTPYTPPARFRIFGNKKKDGGSSGVENFDLDSVDKGKKKITSEELEEFIALYDANILYADDFVKRILEYLETKADIENTILIITSDHGEAFMEHGRIQHNSTVYDEMIHVPFIVRFPREISITKSRYGEMASLIDVAPTILDIMGVSQGSAFQGKILLPAIFRGGDVRPFIYAWTRAGGGTRAVRDANYKYIYQPRKGGDELYHLSTDPLEKTNLASERKVLAGYYRQELLRIERDSLPPQRDDLDKVDLHRLDSGKLKRLKELGYLR